MRGKGVHYDTGTRMPRGWTREAFDAATVRRDMRIIADDLHCTAVRITGGEPDRLTVAATHAADAGLEVWFAPFPSDLTPDELLPLLVDCADRAERLRRDGAEVVLVLGGELSVFCRGFLPGEDIVARSAFLRTPDARAVLATLPDRLNDVLGKAAVAVRERFGGAITYASLPFERVDWAPFDYVGADAYRSAHNAATFRAEVGALRRHGRPVVVTEFGCCTFRGAADLGARGWMVVDRDTWRLDGHYERDEEGQATYLRELLTVFEEEDVDTAFWFTFAGFRYPHHPDPRHDLDLASYGLIRLDSDGTWSPKASFHALAHHYAR